MDDAEKPTAKLNDEEKLERFREWFKLANEAEAEQRKREEEDLDFQIPENQWPPEAKKARAGRPMLSISLLHQPLALVRNQAASAHLGVELHPVSEDANKELAEVKQGLYSRIQRDGMAQQARLWAFDRAAQCGRGWYRIGTQMDEDSDDPTDQEIVYERILHQEMVYPDPAAQKPDFSDGRFIIVAAFVPLSDFREEYPDAKLTDDSTWRGLQDICPEWVRANGESHDPLVAEIFYRKTKTVKMGGKAVPRKYVCRAVVTGAEILEDKPWMAPTDSPEEGRRFFPIVPVIGRELQPILGSRRWEGIVRPARDGQRFHNYAASSLVEAMALEPKAPFLIDKRAIEGYEKMWDAANTENLPYLLYNGVTDGQGQPIPPPQRQQVDGSRMQLSVMALNMSRDFVQSATAVHEPSLGEMPKQKDAQSGRAILALQQQSDAGTSHYLESLKSITLPLDARIVLDMIPIVYDRPGRVTQILGAEDKPRPVMLGKPHVMKNGRPQAVAKGTQGAKEYNLADGRYSIVATVGKSPQTRLEQGQEFLTAVVQAVPGLTPIIGDVMFRFRDEPGAKEIADRLERQIRAQHPELFDDQDETPEAIRAKAAAMQQQLGMLQQKLQQAEEYIKTEQAKVQGNVAIAQAAEESKVMIAQLDNATKLKLAELQAAQKVADGETKIRDAERDRQHESHEGREKRFHETQMEHEKMAHEVAMKAAGATTTTFTRENGQDQDEERSKESGSNSAPPAEGA